MEKTLQEQVMVVRQKLQYHFASPSTGGWDIPDDMPFMKELTTRLLMRCSGR